MSHEYRLIRSARRSLAIEVTREGEVLVRAPQRMAQSTIEHFVTSHTAWIEEKLHRQKTLAEKYPEPDAAERAALIAAANEIILEKVARYAAQMGLTPRRVRITDAKKRFGSCSGDNALCFSWRLMRYPDAAIDYVVVHELAHIVHKNHGPAFYAMIARYLPDYRDRIKLLKE
ncbi:MAG: M48 family metallopeptidase [Ruminococcaceae bacterium]|nr:M48 family metallopeptidase [Oscillospiraceae bacterium]